MDLDQPSSPSLRKHHNAIVSASSETFEVVIEFSSKKKKENSVELTTCPCIDFALELVVCHLLASSGIIIFYNSAAP